MYLSRLILNPMSRRVQRELADAYQLHRTLLRSFPTALAQGQERMLYRLEPACPDGGIPLLMQSWEAPQWDWLDEPGARGCLLESPACKPFELHLTPRQTLAFRLRANPTVRRNGKRLGLLREGEQLTWLQRKAAASGFALLGARTSAAERVYGNLPKAKLPQPAAEGDAEPALRLLAVQFDGLLRVTAAADLANAVRSGIGSGKAWGCGLLSLAPPR